MWDKQTLNHKEVNLNDPRNQSRFKQEVIYL
jgi:hypothetical protein